MPLLELLSQKAHPLLEEPNSFTYDLVYEEELACKERGITRDTFKAWPRQAQALAVAQLRAERMMVAIGQYDHAERERRKPKPKARR